jgi:2-polyprenyl-6-methoxyphenol hydroxylase-like FAD-dependent oxidoreductase
MSTHFLWQRAGPAAGWGLLGRLRAAAVRPSARSPRPRPGADFRHWADRWQARPTPTARGGPVLDALLVEAAAEAGADLIERFVAGEVIWSDGRAAGVRGHHPGSAGSSLQAAVVVGADGMHSGIARRVGARAYKEHPPLTAVYYSYWSGTRGLGASFHARPGQLILTWPTNDDLTCIYVAWPRRTSTRCAAT